MLMSTKCSRKPLASLTTRLLKVNYAVVGLIEIMIIFAHISLNELHKMYKSVKLIDVTTAKYLPHTILANIANVKLILLKSITVHTFFKYLHAY